jgi:SAM-dependent methyltransferase
MDEDAGNSNIRHATAGIDSLITFSTTTSGASTCCVWACAVPTRGRTPQPDSVAARPAARRATPRLPCGLHLPVAGHTIGGFLVLPGEPMEVLIVGFRQWLKPRLQDMLMRSMNDLRPDTVSLATGEVLEVGFGTALNLRYYGDGVTNVTGLDPLVTDGVDAVDQRIAAVRFPVERAALRADGELPFDAGRFDTIVTTWTLCSIPDALMALDEMRRVLKPGGKYVFIEHGRSETESTARWQDRLNPAWRALTGECNINRRIDELVEKGGFELTSMDRFLGDGPGVLASLYRGVATKA